MLQDLKVKVGPQFYTYHQGAIDEFVPDLLEEYKAKNVLIVHGTISFDKAKKFMHFIESDAYHFVFHQYTGECSYYGADLIKKIVEERSIDFVIGIGGGKLSDLVGYSCHVCNVPFGLIPTLASNCAPWTSLSVMYEENGMSTGGTEHFKRQAAFLITDPYLVIDSPIRYFKAGLADTIAKWYECKSVLMHGDLMQEPFVNAAGTVAKYCNDMIQAHAEKAIQDMEQMKVTNVFVRLSEIVFALAGLCGGLGDRYARNAAAHAMHDALAKYVPAAHKYLHGEKVAYGILYQMALEGHWKDIDDLLPLYDVLGMPKSLSDLNLSLDGKTLDLIVAFIDSKPKVHLLPMDVTQEKLKKAVYDLEKYMK